MGQESEGGRRVTQAGAKKRAGHAATEWHVPRHQRQCGAPACTPSIALPLSGCGCAVLHSGEGAREGGRPGRTEMGALYLSTSAMRSAQASNAAASLRNSAACCLRGRGAGRKPSSQGGRHVRALKVCAAWLPQPDQHLCPAAGEWERQHRSRRNVQLGPDSTPRPGEVKRGYAKRKEDMRSEKRGRAEERTPGRRGGERSKGRGPARPAASPAEREPHLPRLQRVEEHHGWAQQRARQRQQRLEGRDGEEVGGPVRVPLQRGRPHVVQRHLQGQVFAGGA